MKPAVALRLGRVSNLPTVWSNVCTGVALAGVAVADARLFLLLLALSLFYVGGMFLNDAFDREFDARNRPERPIPSGQVTAAQVFGFGFGMLAIGVALLGYAGYRIEPFTQWRPIVAGLALAVAVTFYNWHHKDNPLSPLVMGVCRMLIYVSAAFAVQSVLPGQVWIAAVVLLCYLIGLTYVAKQEHLNRLGSLWPKQEHLNRLGSLWPLVFLTVPVAYGVYLVSAQPLVISPLVLLVGWMLYALSLLRRRGPGDVPRAVVSLIAGISLLDAMLLTGNGAVPFAWFAILAFGLTLILQRWVAGT